MPNIRGQSRTQYLQDRMTAAAGPAARKLLGRRLSQFLRELFTPRKPQKVFCVGWFKTGTTSFKSAMRALGYKHCGWSARNYELYKQGRFDELAAIARRYDSFDDSPWNHTDLIQFMDREFPGSKFVMLTRDVESWAQSYQKMCERKGNPGHWKPDSIETYIEHDRSIREYFKGTEQLLEMNIFEGDGYAKLAPFVLGKFPHENKAPATVHEIKRTA